MVEAMEASIEAGIRGIDVRDERAGTFAAIAYSRLRQEPAVVMTCSGPGTANTLPGVNHAFVDGAPIVVLGGSTALFQRGRGAFQDTDQIGLMRPITKWSHQVHAPEHIPDAIRRALQVARSGAPGPVYVDLPSDVLHGEVAPPDEPATRDDEPRAAADPARIAEAVKLIARASRPIVVVGSGIVWSRAWDELRTFVEQAGIPVYTTPMARGVVAEDHPLAFPAARSTALREADCLVVIGTRSNYIVNWLRAPVVNQDSALIEINNDPTALSTFRRADVAIVADARVALGQLSQEVLAGEGLPDFEPWRQRLAEVNQAAREKVLTAAGSDETPMHPLSLCGALDRWLPRDSVLAVDGHEILGFSRRSIAAYHPGNVLSPGPYGTMGVGIPFGLGAKVARPDWPVVVLTGDGAFGFQAMELDTAVRHGLGFVIVIANNGGWAGGDRLGRPGRALPTTEYHRLAEAFGCLGTRVVEQAELVPALDKAMAFVDRERRPAIVEVMVSSAVAGGRSFTASRPGQADSYSPV